MIAGTEKVVVRPEEEILETEESEFVEPEFDPGDPAQLSVNQDEFIEPELTLALAVEITEQAELVQPELGPNEYGEAGLNDGTAKLADNGLVPPEFVPEEAAASTLEEEKIVAPGAGPPAERKKTKKKAK